jgi:hypothetical protein
MSVPFEVFFKSLKCKYNWVMTKKLELQNSKYSYVCKPNINLFKIQKGYLIHFETNLMDFYDFGCVRWRTTKSWGAPKTTGQCQRIYEYLSTSLPSLHFMLQLECNYNTYPILFVITLKFINYLILRALVK